MIVRKWSLVAAVGCLFLSHQLAAVRADAPATTTVPNPPTASPTVPGNPAEQTIQQDRKNVRTDQQNAHNKRLIIRNDRKVISQDRMDMQNARKDMQINPQNKAADQAKITADQQGIKTERQDITKNRQDLKPMEGNARTDLNKLRSDRPSTPATAGTRNPTGGMANGNHPNHLPGRPSSVGPGFMAPSHQGQGTHNHAGHPVHGGGAGAGHPGRR